MVQISFPYHLKIYFCPCFELNLLFLMSFLLHLLPHFDGPYLPLALILPVWKCFYTLLTFDWYDGWIQNSGVEIFFSQNFYGYLHCLFTSNVEELKDILIFVYVFFLSGSFYNLLFVPEFWNLLRCALLGMYFHSLSYVFREPFNLEIHVI